jgi:hypothetical protein
MMFTVDPRCWVWGRFPVRWEPDGDWRGVLVCLGPVAFYMPERERA